MRSVSGVRPPAVGSLVRVGGGWAGAVGRGVFLFPSWPPPVGGTFDDLPRLPPGGRGLVLEVARTEAVGSGWGVRLLLSHSGLTRWCDFAFLEVVS